MASFACTIERITSASPSLPRATHQASLTRTFVLFRSLLVSPARLLSGAPVDAASIVYVDAYNDNARPLTHSARCRVRNVDNDGAAVIRRTGDCCRTVQLDPDRSRPIRGSSGINRHCIPQMNVIGNVTSVCASKWRRGRYHHGSKVRFTLCAWFAMDWNVHDSSAQKLFSFVNLIRIIVWYIAAFFLS